jgi:nucleoid DNA-binding protein
MNDEKISLQEFIDLFAQKANLKNKVAEDFIKAAVSLIEEALLKGESVKIKNFGVFKPQWIEPRKSVDVNTGNEIILPGSYKISFTPDETLQSIVNEPFSYLEAVELDNENANKKNEEEALEPLKIFSEQADEIKSIIAEIQSMSSHQEKEENKENEKKQEKLIPTEKEHKTAEKIFEPEKSKTEVIENEKFEDLEEIKVEKLVSEEIQQEKNNEVFDKENVKPKENSFLEELDEDIKSEPIGIPFHAYVPSEEYEFHENTEKKRFSWIWIPVVLILLLGGAGALYYFYSPVKEFVNLKMVKKTPALVETTLPSPAVLPDTIEQQKKPEEVDSLQILFDTPRAYSEFIAKERIRSGSRLARMAMRYYGAPEFWVYIYEANRDKIPSPNDVPVGTLIKIPKLDARLIDVSNPRCMEKAKELSDLYLSISK